MHLLGKEQFYLAVSSTDIGNAEEVEALHGYIEGGQRHPQYSQTQGKDVDAVILSRIHLDDFPVNEAEMTIWGSQGTWIASAIGMISGTGCVFILLVQRQGGMLIVTRDIGAVENFLPLSMRHKGENKLTHGRLVTAFFADGIPIRRLYGFASAALARTQGKPLIERQVALLQLEDSTQT